MMLNVAPVDYERNLALYGISSMAVLPHQDTTPPKREVDEPDAIMPKLRQPPAYENRHRHQPQTHPVAASWRQPPKPQSADTVHQSPLPDLRGVFGMQEKLAEQTPLQLGVLPRQAAVIYGPHPEPPPVNFQFTA